MKVYIIRHGQTENNSKALWTGWQDIPLTKKGEEEAKRLTELFADIHFDAVFTSDLVRARKTAEIALPGCSYKTNQKLREMNVGSIANKPIDCMSNEERALVRKEGYAIFGGETIEEFKGRISEFLKELEALDCQNVAVFCHAGWLRRALAIVLDAQSPKNIVIKNCATLVLEYKNSVWKLYSLMNIS